MGGYAWCLFLVLILAKAWKGGTACVDSPTVVIDNEAFSRIRVNRVFGPGDFICLPGGDHKFGLSPGSRIFGIWDGNNIPIWTPNQRDQTIAGQWVFQGDGNLVLYSDGGSTAIWSSHMESQQFLSESEMVVSKHKIIIQKGDDTVWSVDLGFHGLNCIRSSSGKEGYNLLVEQGASYRRGEGYCFGDYYFGLNQAGRMMFFDFGAYSGGVLWEPTNARGGGETWIFQTDGNLVVYDGNERPVWASSWTPSRHYSASQLMLTETGAGIISLETGGILWRNSDTFQMVESAPDCANTEMARVIISVNELFPRGHFYCPNGAGYFGLDEAGRFGYFVDSKVLWSPSEFSDGDRGDFWVFQSDGNLVVYDESSRAIWASQWERRYSDGAGSDLELSASGIELRKWGRTLWSASWSSDAAEPPPETSDAGRRELVYVAYYYPWYIEGDWSRHGIQDLPLLGFYGTDSPSVAAQHIDWALEAGITSWIVSWWGMDHMSKRHFDEGMLRAPNMDRMKFCMLYESKILAGTSFRDGSAQERLRDDLLSIQRDYFGHPSYLRVNGRPILVFYITRAMFGAGFDRGVLEMLRGVLNENVFFVADEPFFENGNCDPATSANGLQPNGAPIFDAYTTYNMYQSRRVVPGETASDYIIREGLPIFEAWAEETLFFPNVLPMYHDFRGKEPLAGNAQDFLRQLYEVACLPKPPSGEGVPDLVFVTSFNEWWEGTQVEPDATNRYGKEFLHALRDFKREVDAHGYYWC